MNHEKPEALNSTWYIYMVRCEGHTLYTGVTTDLERRFLEHQSQGPKCAKYLRGKAPVTLVYHEQAPNQSMALKRERMIKKLNKSEKEKLIKSFFCKSSS